MENMKTANLNKELQKLLPDTDKFEPELFRNFITYWLIRKSNSFSSTNTLNEVKNSSPNAWLGLIQSNHKFRSLYGEEIAKTLIEMIKESGN